MLIQNCSIVRLTQCIVNPFTDLRIAKRQTDKDFEPKRQPQTDTLCPDDLKGILYREVRFDADDDISRS